MSNIVINTDKCKGCLLCIDVCPQNVIAVANYLNGAGIRVAQNSNNGKCTACRQCAVVCPDVAIEVYR